MSKNNQYIALILLIPMLLFTFIVTVQSENPRVIDESEELIYQYFNFRNNKDLDSIKSLIPNLNDIEKIKKDNEYLESISLLYITEELNESIVKAYLKNNPLNSKDNLKIYKVKYEVLYNSDSILKDKSGIYECWYFLTRINENHDWIIDIGEI